LTASAAITLNGANVLCTLSCVALETETGGATPKTRLHRDIPPLVPVAIDVDGNNPPSLVDLTGLFGADLVVSITGNTSSVPSATDFTLRIDRTTLSVAKLPLRAELISGALDDATAAKTTLGYDARNSNAPRSFVLGVKRTAATTTANGWTQTQTQTDGNLRITAPGTDLALITESFKGAASGNTLPRPEDRSQARLAFGATGTQGPVAGATVPPSVTLKLIDRPAAAKVAGAPGPASPPAQFKPSITQMVLDHTAPVTALGFLTTAPAKPDGDGVLTKLVTTGGVDKLAAHTDLSLTSPDLDADGKGDAKVDYVASAPATAALVRMRETKGAGRATRLVRLTGAPAELHAGVADTALSADMSRIRVDWTASATTDLRFENDVDNADQSRLTTVDMRSVPRRITNLEYLSEKRKGTVTYKAVATGTDAGRAGRTEITSLDRRGEDEFRAEIPVLPLEIERLQWHTPLNQTTVSYAASHPTPKATVYIADGNLDELPPSDDSKTFNTVVEDVPTAFDLTIDTAETQRGVSYKASGKVTRVTVDGTNDGSFMGEKDTRGVVDTLNLTLEDVPLSVCGDFTKTDELSADAGSGGIGSAAALVCDGESALGLFDLRLHGSIPGGVPALPAGTEGLLLRDRATTTPDGPAPAYGEFAAVGRLSGLRSFALDKQEQEVDDLSLTEVTAGLDATGTAPRVVDVARHTDKTIWTNCVGPEADGEIVRAGIETVLAKVPEPPSDLDLTNFTATKGELCDSSGNYTHLDITSNAVSDPASGEPAVSLKRGFVPEDPEPTDTGTPEPVWVYYETRAGEKLLPEDYPVEEFASSSDISLDPLPRHFRVCRADTTNECTKTVFREEHFVDSNAYVETKEDEAGNPVETEYQESRSFDFGPSDANGGSFRMNATSPVAFGLRDEATGHVPVHMTVGIEPDGVSPSGDGTCDLLEGSLDPPEPTVWLCVDEKPGPTVADVHLTGSELSFQSHAEGSGGFLAPLAGFGTKGYLAMHTGWTADCFSDGGDPIVCPWGTRDDTGKSKLNFHTHRPPTEAFRLSGDLKQIKTWQLPSEVGHTYGPGPFLDAIVDGETEATEGFEFGPLFGADHRIFEADPSDFEGEIIGVADVKNRSGHIYCDAGTAFFGSASGIGDQLCDAGTEGNLLP
jgi:hypothetical protein